MADDHDPSQSGSGALPREIERSGADQVPVLADPQCFWRKANAERFTLLIDAADYFAAARESMMQARHSILLVGWDFDLRIDLLPHGTEDGMPSELGDFLKALVHRNPDLHIYILKWDMAVLYTLGSQMLPRLALDLYAVTRIKMRFDSNHPWGAAHHQKIVVIDDDIAYCGGIDMTTDRWDTRKHLPGDDRRRRPDGSRSGPWHDATAVLDGAAAAALGDLCRQRWRGATGRDLPAPRKSGPGVDLWPTKVRPQLCDVEVAIARTMPAHGRRPRIHEIEELYRAAILAARRTIYIESQYFASVSICDALSCRLAEPDGPEVVVVNPLSTFGWLEEHTMETARHLRLAEVREADRHGRFAIFHPVNAAGEPIYVHAKVLVIDDRLIRVGSSNVNNRSMGTDTECDLAIEARTPEQADVIRSMRDDLLAEHLDCGIDELREQIRRQGSLLGAIAALRRDQGRSLLPIPEYSPGEFGLALSRSRIADPERPMRPETMVGHAFKRVALRVPLSAWGVIGIGSAIAAAIWTGRRYRPSRHGTRRR